jgi:pSer/pThr/pTyr-binding forkhead associated (FHA) protein/HD-GYP domain-containing protein (c-di-GMP phosphodiesterase class II)
MSKLRIQTGPYRGREKTVGDKPVSIGRDAEAGIQILDRAASRFHCEVFPVGGMWFVKDLESKNGTYVNDERLEDEELLRFGDVIKIGTTELIFESGAALSDEDSSARVSYNDDPEVLSNTLEFRVDELSDISEPQEQSAGQDNGKGLRILYQVSRILSDATTAGAHEARVLELLVQSMPAECALVFRRDATTGKLVPSTVRTSAPHIQPLISRSIIKKTFTENKALHSANAQDDERFERHASIVAKNIRSVVCVPLASAGAVRGVVYLSRGNGQSPFDQFDLELVSACAIQLGLAQHAEDERRKHRAMLDEVVTTMVRALESRAGLKGTGERCARTATALASALGLAADARERLRTAALLHHFPWLCDNTSTGSDSAILARTERAEELLGNIKDLDGILPLVRLAHERLDGNGPLRLTEDELDIDARTLAVATAFEERQLADPGRGAAQVIDDLFADAGLDRKVVGLLKACHLDGSLYNS